MKFYKKDIPSFFTSYKYFELYNYMYVLTEHVFGFDGFSLGGRALAELVLGRDLEHVLAALTQLVTHKLLSRVQLPHSHPRLGDKIRVVILITLHISKHLSNIIQPRYPFKKYFYWFK